jgi:hypothetical protein
MRYLKRLLKQQKLTEPSEFLYILARLGSSFDDELEVPGSRYTLLYPIEAD